MTRSAPPAWALPAVRAAALLAAHYAASLNALEEALKAPLQRSGA